MTSPLPQPTPRQPRAAWFVVALLITYWLLAVSASPRMGVTADEILHLTAGYSYWEQNDYRLQPENGTLAMRAAALPLLAMDLKFPSLASEDWKHSFVPDIGREFFYGLGNPLDRMLLAGRAMMALFGVFTAWLVWRWSRRLFGETAGLVSLALAAFCPALLAHGGLVTSDMALTACLFAVVTAFWRVIHVVTWGRLLATVLAGGAVLLAKMSGVLAAPMLAVLLVLRWLRPVPLVVQLGGPTRWVRSRARTVAATLALTLALAAGSVVLLWAGYGFRFEGFNWARSEATSYFFSWPQILDEEAIPDNVTQLGAKSHLMDPPTGPHPTAMTRLIGMLRDHRLLPEAYLWGFAHTYKFSKSRSAFLDGDYRSDGWPQYFPLAFLYKTTLPALGLIVLGTGALAATARRDGPRQRRWLYRALPLLVLGAIYWVSAITAHLNIGHRHILPVYPVAYVLAGAAAYWLLQLPAARAGRCLVGAALALHALAALNARPFFLSYFNPAVGGIEGGWRHLVDSSYDWGQGLPDLKTWLEAKSARGDTSPVYLTYFGSDSPAARGLTLPRFGDEITDSGPRNFPLLPTGGWFVISATHFQRVYLHLAGDWSPRYEQLYAEMRANLTPERARGADPALLLRDAKDLEVLRFGRLAWSLRNRPPDTVIGGSLLAFRLTDAEVNAALNGPVAP
jgi:4-amino-4-deoxy-L-arabinose transferase-like glycosyltransferase